MRLKEARIMVSIPKHNQLRLLGVTDENGRPISGLNGKKQRN
jgi:hypothetical protein